MILKIRDRLFNWLVQLVRDFIGRNSFQGFVADYKSAPSLEGFWRGKNILAIPPNCGNRGFENREFGKLENESSRITNPRHRWKKNQETRDKNQDPRTKNQ
ncbi:hypothetical protein DHB64_17590 [Antarcticibacterium sp. W02-3]|nr:hypothetical protein [Antarcticibacterium sp. W02-3]